MKAHHFYLYMGILFGSLSGQAFTYSPQSFISTWSTGQALKSEKFEVAREQAIKSLGQEPFAPEHHLNLGLAFEGLGQTQKALGSYKMAEKLALENKQGALVFYARFNQGQLLAKAKKINEALDAYQKALEIVPDSIETKINIELLMQQQQGGGGGSGEEQNQDQKEDQQGQKDPKDQKQGQGKEQKNKDPQDVKQGQEYKPDRSRADSLKEDDAKKILEELKRQERDILQNFDRLNQMNKDAPNEKDW